MKDLAFPSTPVLLDQKTVKKHNILIGYDPSQEAFASQFLGVPLQTQTKVVDLDILGKEEPLLLRVDHSWDIELSPQVRRNVGFFSIAPIVKGSSGAYAIVKHACSLLGLTRTQTEVTVVADELCKETVYDIMAAVWEAAWLLTGNPPEPYKVWPEPWTSPNWLPAHVDPHFRLNTLYRDLVAIVYARGDDEEAAHKFGIRPSRYKVLKEVSRGLDLGLLRQSIVELSKWRQQKYDPLICALKITNVWYPVKS